MDILLCTSKEGRIEKRRNKILNKIKEDNNGTEKKLSEIKNNFEENDKENEDNQYSLVNNFEYTNNEHTENYANIKNDIISRLSEKKNDYLHELSNKRNNEEKHFLQNIKKYSTDTLTKNNALNFDQYIDYKNDFPEHTYVSSFQYNMMDVTNLALKEKETYKKKVDKYFSLLKYKDEQIKKVCEINSKNVTTFISFVRNQMEGYKIYLEDILNKTRDDLNEKRKLLLNNNKEILDDFLRMRNLNSNTFVEDLESEKILNEKIKKEYETKHLDLKLKNELLENNLNNNIRHLENINHILMDKEKKLYSRKLLEQKNSYNLKLINFYKLEINKLRESLLSVKTYYYNYKIKSKKNINELINQYERIKYQFIELQKRQKSYEKNFQKKYAKAWDLQRKEAMIYIEKLISANKIIHEQIFLKDFQETNYKYLIQENIHLVTSHKDDENTVIEMNIKKVTPEQIEKVKKLLLQECLFLIDETNIKDEEEKIRKILNYIGVHTKEDLELLTELFYIDADEENYLINKFNKNEDENNIPYNSEYTLDIILKYYQEKEKENTCRISKDKQKYKNRLNISLKIILDRKKQEKEYWYNLSNLTPDHMITLWKTFSIYVEKYYHILKERASIIQNIFDEEKLMKQNINKINRMKKELS
ncbi:hypothetical protein CYL21_2197 [Plasmodium falciparum NF54]|uniref:Dynein regulatory complex protein 1 C-terminal domain-containing protein n=4 Tax=Plasmodium falciparum TaxID=5833 RepID=A0A144A137_PLAF7|nr:conserved Plasmodium protein, unknown function [Plasmodium falciparum 3D7]KAF4329043.1 hypothetical protein CYL21_2197 [Plasmodium falciparum NF54]PKC49943.1 hypothetical protein CK202_0685 [Plasmodium falciparum NF54]CZT99739.1 conserved Plasmodium protein, unknown function [Plasmodium falciparum 3D7]|eukprot:XP_024329186.1 conserved Plasmodium protein, unknown function [Plasmodium falciparum 3D7]